MNNQQKHAEDTGRSMTLDCVDFWLDEPGDTTVRPCPPYLLEHAMAERDKILAALKSGSRPYADTEERAEAERLRLITVYEAAIARDAAEQGKVLAGKKREPS